MRTPDERKAAIALGVCLVCLVFGLETWVAHRRAPSPASPYVWAALGGVAIVALACALHWRRRPRRARRPLR